MELHTKADRTASDPSAAKLRPAGLYNPWLAVIYAVLVYFAAQYLAGFVISLYPVLRGWSHQQTVDWVQGGVVAQFWYVLLAEALTFGAILWFLRRRKLGLGRIGFRKPRAVDVVIGLAGFAVYFVAYLILFSVVSNLIPGFNGDQQQQLGFDNPAGNLALVLTFISLVVLPPIVEELVFRGFIFTGLRGRLKLVWAVLLTSLLFGTAHLQIGSGKPLLWVAALDTFTLSCVLCVIREKTGRLAPGMFIHGLKNGIAFFVLYLAPLIHLKM